MTSLFEKRLTRFMDRLHFSQTIRDYFNIKNGKNDNFNFIIKKYGKALLFNISFRKKYFYKIENLPIEINALILSFCEDQINIKIHITYEDDYPFSYPIWHLISVDHNICTLLNLEEYYDYMVANHNSAYKKNWSPAIDIDIDILDFIRKILHFDFVLEYK